MGAENIRKWETIMVLEGLAVFLFFLLTIGDISFSGRCLVFVRRNFSSILHGKKKANNGFVTHSPLFSIPEDSLISATYLCRISLAFSLEKKR